jgi:HlyD family secretion protein
MRFLLVYVLVCFTLLGCGSSEESAKPTMSTMTESVYASVSITPVDFYEAYAAIPGILDRIYVQEGDTVAADEVIAEIKAESVQIGKRDAALNLQLAEEDYKGKAAVLSSLATEIASMKEQVRSDSLAFVRQERLWNQNIGSQVQYENAQLKYDIGKRTLLRLEKNYEQTRIDLEGGYKRAKNALEMANTSVNDHRIRSRRDGKIYAVLKEEGELLSQLEAVAQIGSLNDFLLEMAIDEVDVARVRIGQSVYITLDAYGKESFKAMLTRIIPIKDQRTQTFRVEAEFIEAPPVLYAGLSGEANILIASHEQVMTIPLEYVKGNTVRTKDGEKEVTLGVRNLQRVEVISGLDTSDVLLLPE